MKRISIFASILALIFIISSCGNIMGRTAEASMAVEAAQEPETAAPEPKTGSIKLNIPGFSKFQELTATESSINSNNPEISKNARFTTGYFQNREGSVVLFDPDTIEEPRKLKYVVSFKTVEGRQGENKDVQLGPDSDRTIDGIVVGEYYLYLYVYYDDIEVGFGYTEDTVTIQENTTAYASINIGWVAIHWTCETASFGSTATSFDLFENGLDVVDEANCGDRFLNGHSIDHWTLVAPGNSRDGEIYRPGDHFDFNGLTLPVTMKVTWVAESSESDSEIRPVNPAEVDTDEISLDGIM